MAGSEDVADEQGSPRLPRLGAIYASGALGALARVGLAEAVPRGAGQWPWATFTVNMAGALLGYVVARLRDHPEEASPIPSSQRVSAGR